MFTFGASIGLVKIIIHKKYGQSYKSKYIW